MYIKYEHPKEAMIATPKYSLDDTFIIFVKYNLFFDCMGAYLFYSECNTLYTCYLSKKSIFYNYIVYVTVKLTLLLSIFLFESYQ